MKKEEVKYVPCVIQPPIEDDEIDLKQIIILLLKYKKFIFLFTFIITVLALIYAYTIKPIYEIKANIQLGYISNSNSNSNSKIYLLEPQATMIYIINKFDKSKDINASYPKVNVNIIKKTKDILNISVQNFSNTSAKEYLIRIVNTLKKQENSKLYAYIQNINSQIQILNNQIKTIQNEIILLNKSLPKIKDTNIYQLTLNKINDYQNQITDIKLKIADLKTKISPINITKTHIIGTIKQNPNPIKPKKKLIVIIAFITGLILSIFLVFFIEFVKSLKEQNQ
ncbi:chain length determinant protein [Nautilia profundicola AmH]|uniref:Chain length determinant protein n=1 Tax=Nautilia profundicola (strain ATCC BAA-1463 / DSM 18972 / AmH) TaxID=598659 RepID=B9L6P5_NAUPA|nr:Wzz/FepE/Etk N-terminal domain-containing protein [Nautilia profundicola]ACM92415.1 chain length determinant protein [Nautilia profundicola AmH]